MWKQPLQLFWYQRTAPMCPLLCTLQLLEKGLVCNGGTFMGWGDRFMGKTLCNLDPIAKWARDQTIGSQLGGKQLLQGSVLRRWPWDHFRLGHRPVWPQKTVRPSMVSLKAEHLATTLSTKYSRASVNWNRALLSVISVFLKKALGSRGAESGGRNSAERDLAWSGTHQREGEAWRI